MKGFINSGVIKVQYMCSDLTNFLEPFIWSRASPGTWAGLLCRDLTSTKNSIALFIMFYLVFI